MKVSVFLSTIALAGTVLADSFPRPLIPRWIDSEKHGFGYLFSKTKKGGASYQGYIELSYDMDYDCMRTAFSNYTDMSFQESTYCKGVLTEYTSFAKECRTDRSVTKKVSDLISGWVGTFVRNLGTDFADPIWREGDYSVIKNPLANQLLYIRQSDKAVEFIVDQNDLVDDFIYFFPTGLVEDRTVLGVWDFNMKYGQCPNEDSHLSMIQKGPLAGFLNEKPTSLPSFPEMPDSIEHRPVVHEKRLGGVRA